MMVASMTAFARQDAHGDWGAAVWEIRTVNHRYLDVSLRLADELRVLENKVREHIVKKLNRGRVEASLHYEIPISDEQLQVNHTLAAKVIETAENLQINGPTSINRLEVLRWPGVLIRKPVNTDALTTPVLKLLDDTLDSVLASRQREGKKIASFIQQRCDSCSQQLKILRENMPAIINSIKARYLANHKDAAVELDSERLEQEFLILCQKMDVAEELDRIQTHIGEVERMLTENKPMGRRLNFSMQELHREASTLGAKSAHVDMSHTSVDLRVLIEQMREQVQNIE